MDIYSLATVPEQRKILEGVPYEEYANIPALRASVIKDGLFRDIDRQPVVSPLHIKASFEGASYKETESMLFGSALHCLLLEPDEFTKRFCQCDIRRDERTKAYQEFLEENRGKHVLKSTGPLSYEWCLKAAEQLCQSAAVQPYIAEGQREVTGLAPIGDIQCKVRWDWLSSSMNAILDVKTTRSVDPLGFWYEFARYGYGIQLALYRQVYEEITQVRLPVVIVAVENQPPFCSVVYQIPEALLDQELRTIHMVVKKVRECLDSGDWPAFDYGVELPLSVPDYVMEVEALDWSE